MDRLTSGAIFKEASLGSAIAGTWLIDRIFKGLAELLVRKSCSYIRDGLMPSRSQDNAADRSCAELAEDFPFVVDCVAFPQLGYLMAVRVEEGDRLEGLIPDKWEFQVSELQLAMDQATLNEASQPVRR